ncbi:N-acetylmuramoyl-L-alanine amidase family protein [Cerasicoccus fimbriatus]|uniref:N-acetylmuramoyl-L-alanine amidase family protein n=1 Tax=Cerasicoccus fimbriatus TaxID=3014554 RepID=UPI0022B2F5C6|nr:N-acetylmuramoyl-L-alanine amidase [Cerasicoccus sp. TK19100]
MTFRAGQPDMSSLASTLRRLHLNRVIWLMIACIVVGASLADAVTINGHRYVSLPDVATRFGMDHSWLVRGKEAQVGSQWSDLRFTLHKRDITYNGDKIYLGAPVALHNGVLHITEVDYEQTLKPLFFPQQFDPKPKLYHIVLDPGHGGKDGGAQNPSLKLQEKYLAMDLANRVKSRLERYGYKVSLTRTTDKYISLSERPAIANRLNADLFVSLHFNAINNSKVDGIETFVMTPPGHASTNSTSADSRSYAGNKDAPWSLMAGYYIQSAMVEKTRADDRGLKRARFAVLKSLECPGVLVEGGFVSHPTEGRNIGSSAYRDKLADAIVTGILNYQKAINRARGIDS